MAKTKATALAEELEVDFLTISTIIEENVSEDDISGKGKNTWLTEDAVSIVKDKLDIPELVPAYFTGQVTHQAPNPNYVYVYLKELSKKVPVIVPRRFKGKLNGKTIKVEEITDNAGSSYRYIPTRHNT
tara:strand:+ start:689 stop:1075 length:387 start_codon:yes stop_codon:yes gene_type:complete